MSTSFEKDILDELAKLGSEQQRQVLDFTRALTASPIGRRGEELLTFAGAISTEDLKMMTSAIEEGCEQVNINEW
ncbi:MAG TPA: hypothetical protein VFC63_28365 [Blastocatellia bacterium]|nr:hypothetical protein [Blastocatellia bacterium]